MAHPDDSTSSAPTSATHDVMVRRSPRFVRFIAVGIALAILITLILTFVFPEQPNYSRAQVFGFVGVILVTVFIGLSAAVAVGVDRASSRRARTVVMTTSERVEGNDEVNAAEVGTNEGNVDEVNAAEVNAAEKPDENSTN